MAQRDDIESAMNSLLEVGRLRDYGPNGLQVEGRAEVRRIVSGVTASRALIEAALRDKADAIVVHHGLFWRGQDGRVTGWLKAAARSCCSAHDINLFAYHLPLDAHPRARQQRPARPAPRARRPTPASASRTSASSARSPMRKGSTPSRGASSWRWRARRWSSPATAAPLRRIAWCTGGAQGYFEAAIAAGADAYPHRRNLRAAGALRARDRRRLPGLRAPRDRALRRAGASPRTSPQQFGLEHAFIDIDNPA